MQDDNPDSGSTLRKFDPRNKYQLKELADEIYEGRPRSIDTREFMRVFAEDIARGVTPSKEALSFIAEAFHGFLVRGITLTQAFGIDFPKNGRAKRQETRDKHMRLARSAVKFYTLADRPCSIDIAQQQAAKETKASLGTVKAAWSEYRKHAAFQLLDLIDLGKQKASPRARRRLVDFIESTPNAKIEINIHMGRKHWNWTYENDR